MLPSSGTTLVFENSKPSESCDVIFIFFVESHVITSQCKFSFKPDFSELVSRRHMVLVSFVWQFFKDVYQFQKFRKFSAGRKFGRISKNSNFGSGTFKITDSEI